MKKMLSQLRRLLLLPINLFRIQNISETHLVGFPIFFLLKINLNLLFLKLLGAKKWFTFLELCKNF